MKAAAPAAPADERLALADMMIAALAREIVDGDVVGIGLGTPLAVAAGLLARATHAPDAHLLVGGAVDPQADLATCLSGPAGLLGHTCGFVPHLDTMGMAEGQTMTLQFLRPAQVDGRGNLNTSRVGRGAHAVRLPGGLATADVPRLLPRLVVYLPRHRLRALPERVDVITGPGGGWHDDAYAAAGPVRLVTDMAVVTFAAERAVLETVHPGVEEHVLVEETGFALSGARPPGRTPEPSAEVRATLNALDPTGLRAKEIA